MRTIKRLLWLGKFPAAYNRSLISLLETEKDIDIRYIFIPRTDAEQQEYSYEQGAISNRTVIYTRNSKKACNSLIKEYGADPAAGIFFYGVYPRILLWWAIRMHHQPCCKLFFSDSNIIEQSKWPQITRVLYGWLLGGFDYLMVIGSYNALYYRWLFGPQKYSSINLLKFPLPHVHDQNEIPAQLAIPDSVVRFLYLGRLPTLKNVISLVKAAEILHKKSISTFHLTIAGDGETFASINSYVERNKLGAFVDLVGGVPSNATQDVYAKNHVFVFPSHHDRWAMVINEAMSAGLPVIAPAWVGAAADLVVDGYTGLKLYKNTPEDLASAMLTYIQNPALIIEQSRNAQRYVEINGKTIKENIAQFRRLFALE